MGVTFLAFFASSLAVVSLQPVDPTTVPCGVPLVQPRTRRIVGGTIATPGSWPWTVALVSARGRLSGSGSIIHPHVILTSAQRFEGPNITLFDLNLRYWRIYAGEYNISIKDPYEQYYHINRVVIHPAYNYSTLENDVAIILTKEPIQFNNHTRPGCLPDSSHWYRIGQTCYLPGWGVTINTGNEEVMNQISMPILTDSICTSEYHDGFIPIKQICAGYKNGGKDFCGDDVGGPLMCRDTNSHWYLQGIASGGGDCRTADQPGLFTAVRQYLDWIKRVIEDAGYSYIY